MNGLYKIGSNTYSRRASGASYKGKSGRGHGGALKARLKSDSQRRNSEFDPLVLPKGQTTTAKVESVITSLYAKGMSTQERSAIRF